MTDRKEGPAPGWYGELDEHGDPDMTLVTLNWPKKKPPQEEPPEDPEKPSGDSPAAHER